MEEKTPKVAVFFQEYLNIEIVNFLIRTSETPELAKLKLEKIGRRIGEKMTEVYDSLRDHVNFLYTFFFSV